MEKKDLQLIENKLTLIFYTLCAIGGILIGLWMFN